MKLSLPTLISLSLALAVSGCEKNSHVAGPDSMHETPNVETQDSGQNSVVNHDSNHDSISNNTTSESGNGYSVNSVSDNSASDSNNNYVTSNSGDGYSMNIDEYSKNFGANSKNVKTNDDVSPFSYTPHHNWAINFEDEPETDSDEDDKDPFNVLYSTFEGKISNVGPDHNRYTDELDEEAFQALIQSGIDINVRNKDGMTVLMLAYTEDAMNALIKAGIDVNAKDKNGMTALMHLAASSTPYNADILIKAGANVNAKDNSGRTALMHVQTIDAERSIAWSYEEEDYSAFVKTLIDAGANVKLKDKSGSTALMRALPPQAIQYLIEAGADVNAKNKYGQTPLMTAIYPNSVKYLVAAGANVNAKDNSGKTALMYMGDPDTIEALIKAGADVKAKDKDGFPAFLYSYIRQFPSDAGPFFHDYDSNKVVEMYRDAGAQISISKSQLKLLKSACASQKCQTQCNESKWSCKFDCDCDEDDNECDDKAKSCLAKCTKQSKSCFSKCSSSHLFDKLITDYEDHEYDEICEDGENYDDFMRIVPQDFEPDDEIKYESSKKSKSRQNKKGGW